MASETSSLSYEELESIAQYLKKNTKYRPKIGIICGTGLGNLVNVLENQDVFPYDKIEKFPVSTVPGHAGNLVFGTLKGKHVVCMQGRFHYYEGYPLNKITIPVRVMHLLGVKIMIVTNAAGGINPNFNVGDLMILKDHINFLGMAGLSPLRGPNCERFGPRFPAMTEGYNKELRKLAKSTAEDLQLGSILREGVYACVGGPAFETTAEIKLLHVIQAKICEFEKQRKTHVGADAVGMSTAHEVVVATHCGIQCLGLSLITNAATYAEEENNIANHEEVLEVGKNRSADVEKLVSCIVQNIND